ncbi:prokaryotic cytochrome b561 family protein [Yersinia rohdei]|uniref:Cytochrome b(N-terminal)/b6/petB n=1 Tax=Yersinia rohdei TaxID=29485 RepID=A0A0U1HSG1_YERRO|nr:cytochrome b/b6 domain-containing protein [Yersinia rohdei]AJJ10245.1 prokaryotic cytochrome b561 family protein [Yersinia rohdei]EEQ01125.1 hypothetical protein yrohd0001_34870 [Yersinia rohdei ATCC 43380]MDN0096797.1 cytochrome b/b6 domain-containing protein [Yersinia rohdei]OWF80034.1 hypothetical protein B4900_08365 [Yersinia rohdei]CND93200.1 Cytochrome b(N-terminal)/b6/petB [Yersinia rohdei]
MATWLSTLAGSFWSYLGQYQKLFLRCLHLTLAALIIVQILNSNGMGFTSAQQIQPDITTELFTWMHISIGITLLCLCVVFVIYCLSTRGVRYFYPYLWGDFTQIVRDLNTLIRFKLPESEPRGLATSVQGLGIGALSLVVLSGFTWFILWQSGSAWAADMKSIHKTLTGLIEVYIIAHGGMGLIHFIQWRYNKQ